MRMRWMAIAMVSMGVALTTHARSGTSMNVQVREGQLRERPSYLGAVVTSVEYGEQVDVQRNQGAWRYVAAGDKEGWIHETALSRKRIELVAGDEDVTGAATEGEMALAGKGFSAEVEEEYRARNTEVDFSWVDRMEKMGVPPERLTEFLHEGGVTPEGGK